MPETKYEQHAVGLLSFWCLPHMTTFSIQLKLNKVIGSNIKEIMEIIKIKINFKIEIEIRIVW